MEHLTLSTDGKLATLTLNRADKRNAMDSAMWQQLLDYCDKLRQQPPKLLKLQASGEQTFCAGADIAELQQLMADKAALQANNRLIQQAQQVLENLPCPTVAVINGACFGGGMGLALACDFRIAAEHAQFAITPAKLGLLYTLEDCKRVLDLVGLARAKQLLMTAQPIDAQTAFDWGLVTQLHIKEDLHAAADAFCQQLLSLSSTSLQGIKHTLAHLCGRGNQSAEDIRMLFTNAFDGEDFSEGAAAFLARRPAQFP